MLSFGMTWGIEMVRCLSAATRRYKRVYAFHRPHCKRGPGFDVVQLLRIPDLMGDPIDLQSVGVYSSIRAVNDTRELHRTRTNSVVSPISDNRPLLQENKQEAVCCGELLFSE